MVYLSMLQVLSLSKDTKLQDSATQTAQSKLSGRMEERQGSEEPVGQDQESSGGRPTAGIHF